MNGEAFYGSNTSTGHIHTRIHTCNFIYILCISYILSKSSTENTYLQWASTGLSVSGVGFLILCADINVDTIPRLIFSGTFICMGFALTAHWMLKELTEKTNGHWLMIITGIEVILLGLFTILYPSIPYYVVSLCIGHFIIVLVTGYFSFVKSKKQKNKPLLGLSILHFGLALFFMLPRICCTPNGFDHYK